VLRAKSVSKDPRFFAIVDRASGLAQGHVSLMRDDPLHRVIEVGGIMYSPALQRTRGATEAMYLLAQHAFKGMKYRRYEWKCNALNSPSRAAALRLGFTFEGIFRQHMIIKGVNRDTAWFSMLDSEWPSRGAEFERWLDPGNFMNGRQLTRLDQRGQCFSAP
jgi:RimJ/RimL family protein N-acetyltransferase